MWSRLRRLLRKRSSPEPEETEASGGATRSPVVVGLGNPARRYESTRHNAGFLAADELARRHGGSWRKARKTKAESAKISVGASGATLVKPQTMMNNSGAALTGYRAGDLIVVHDDLDLPPGTVRVKSGGGAGGHNGLRSLTQRVGNDFVRVRVGVGRPPEGATVTDHVLSKMEPEVRDAVPTAADAVEVVVESGPETAMNRFNVRAP